MDLKPMPESSLPAKIAEQPKNEIDKVLVANNDDEIETRSQLVQKFVDEIISDVLAIIADRNEARKISLTDAVSEISDTPLPDSCENKTTDSISVKSKNESNIGKETTVDQGGKKTKPRPSKNDRKNKKPVANSAKTGAQTPGTKLMQDDTAVMSCARFPQSGGGNVHWGKPAHQQHFDPNENAYHQGYAKPHAPSPFNQGFNSLQDRYDEVLASTDRQGNIAAVKVWLSPGAAAKFGESMTYALRFRVPLSTPLAILKRMAVGSSISREQPLSPSTLIVSARTPSVSRTVDELLAYT